MIAKSLRISFVAIVVVVSASFRAFAEEVFKGKAEEAPLSYSKALLYKAGLATAPSSPLKVGPGPYLFIDDFLIQTRQNVERVVNMPGRPTAFSNPVVTGKEDGCFQPYMTILRDDASGKFRLWYGRRTDDLNTSQSRLAYMESNDGITWQRPPRALPDPAYIQFGVSILDEGPAYQNPQARYKYGWWADGGLKIAASPDGLTFTPVSPTPVLLHNHDITSIYYDGIRNRYMATISVIKESDLWSGGRRCTMQSYSQDLINWRPPHYVLLSDTKREAGQVQFYAMDGFLTRGDLIVGMVKVLRDDVVVDKPADPPEQYGMGYTTLAWTRDGETWVRDPEPFFLPDFHPGTWDHAHAWIDEQVLVGDEVFIYYGGYARGHKVNRFEERQIGLVKMKKDRYAGQKASGLAGKIATPVLLIEGSTLSVNVDGDGGTLKVQVTDERGVPVPGFTFAECPAITADAVGARVQWPKSLTELQGKPVKLEFLFDNACLYAFYVEE